MGISIPKNFRFRLPSGEIFSSQKKEALFLETQASMKDSTATPPLRMIDHAELILDIMTSTKGSALWIVEAATSEAKQKLLSEMPNLIIFGTTLVGRFEPSLNIINTFWNIHSKLDSSEPWNYELPWGMFCVKEQPVWHNQKHAIILGTILEDWDNLYGAFVQTGWHAFICVKKTEASVQRVEKEFPSLFQK